MANKKALSELEADIEHYKKLVREDFALLNQKMQATREQLSPTKFVKEHVLPAMRRVVHRGLRVWLSRRADGRASQACRADTDAHHGWQACSDRLIGVRQLWLAVKKPVLFTWRVG